MKGKRIMWLIAFQTVLFIYAYFLSIFIAPPPDYGITANHIFWAILIFCELLFSWLSLKRDRELPMATAKEFRKEIEE